MQYRPAIVVVAYNRAKPLERLLKSIKEAKYGYDDIALIISIDYNEQNGDVIELAEQFEWKYGTKLVKLHTSNLGLKKHIIECGNYTNEYGSIILLEDDLYVAPYFYDYVVKTFEKYGENEKVAGVALYSHENNGYASRPFSPINNGYDSYFGQFSVTWGQAWTRVQWNQFKAYMDNVELLENDYQIPEPIWSWKQSWGKYFVYFIKQRDKYYVMPYQPMATCFSEPGVHSDIIDTQHQVNIGMGKRDWKFPEFDEGIHYNLFFENQDLQAVFPKGLNGDFCIDLYGVQGKNYDKYDYVLTPNILDKEIVVSYGMEMRPLDLNVWCGIEGKQIFLYNMKVTEKNTHETKRAVLNYIMTGKRWNWCLVYGISEFLRLSLNKVRKCLTRRK